MISVLVSDALQTGSRPRALRSRSRTPILPESSTEGSALIDFRFLAHGPSAAHCCDVGDTTARRRQGCTLAWHAANRARTVQNAELRRLYGLRDSPSSRAQAREMADKVAACYQSPFSRHFKKCCFYRTQYNKAMALCRDLRTGRERKTCRKEARDEYL